MPASMNINNNLEALILVWSRKGVGSGSSQQGSASDDSRFEGWTRRGECAFGGGGACKNVLQTGLPFRIVHTMWYHKHLYVARSRIKIYRTDLVQVTWFLQRDFRFRSQFHCSNVLSMVARSFYFISKRCMRLLINLMTPNGTMPSIGWDLVMRIVSCWWFCFWSDEFTAAFGRHQEVFGKLDICINNAGISNGPEPFYESDAWRKIIEVNLVAVIDGTSKAVPYFTPFRMMLLDFFSCIYI